MEELSRYDVKNVVVLLAGPRTGSSFLFHSLRSQAEFVALPGEETPYLRLAGLGKFTGLQYSDAITSAPSDTLDKVGHLLLRNSGFLKDEYDDVQQMFQCFCDHLTIQWPKAFSTGPRSRSLQQFESWIRRSGNQSLRSGNRYADWISHLKGCGVSVDANLFSTRGNHPDELPLIEEPPYVMPQPLKAAHAKDLSSTPLLLKTSTNSYRVAFLRLLFPNAQFKWIRLQRNPAASISALMDGWLSSAFHSHDVSPHLTLKIANYSDVTPNGDRYWKFDMPPGWQNYIEKPLDEVCAFQWYAAHSAIERSVTEYCEPLYRLSYEELLDPDSIQNHLNAIIKFVKTRPIQNPHWRATDPVASVSPPQPGKWRKRQSELNRLILENRVPGLTELCHRLNYDVTKMETWP